MLYNILIYIAEKIRLCKFRIALLQSKLFGIEKPVVVYQMGKVGSSSIIYSISKANRNVFQVHRANSKNISELRKRTASQGLRRRVEEPGRYLGKQWEKGNLLDLPVVVLFREPLQRNLSAFFQNQDYYCDDIDTADLANAKLLLESFITKYNHKQPIDWVNSELLHFFPSLGLKNDTDFSCIKNVCMLTTEISDTEKVRVLNTILCPSSIDKILRKNEAVRKPYNLVYQKVSDLARESDEIKELYQNIFDNSIFDYK